MRRADAVNDVFQWHHVAPGLLCVGVCVCMGVVGAGIGQTESVQFFAGTNGCRGDGFKFVVCEVVHGCGGEADGYGPTCPDFDSDGVAVETARMECYLNGELVHRCGVTIELTCTEIHRTPDLDGDGDVDLADFAAFQREFD